MYLYLRKSELSLSAFIIGLLAVVLLQAHSYTKAFTAQAVRSQASVLQANELLAHHLQKRQQDMSTQEKYAHILTERARPTSQEHASSTITLTQVRPANISANAYIVADMHTGTIYTQKNIDKVHPIASITKLLTALTASSVIPPEDTITVEAPWPIQRSDYKQIKKGDTLKSVDAIYPLLMESNNAVAHSLAAHHGTEDFMREMTQQAQAIGMGHTSFTDASGISPQNVSTARDLFKLARHLYTDADFIFDVTRSGTTTVPSERSAYKIGNHNHFSTDTAFIGGKTGYTNAARQTMLSVFTIPIDDTERTVAIIILGSDKRKKDIQGLYRWFTKHATATDNTHNQIFAKDGVTHITGSAGL